MEETQGRNSRQEMMQRLGRNVVYWLALQANVWLTFLIPPRTACSRMALLIVGYVNSHQLLIKKMLPWIFPVANLE